MTRRYHIRKINEYLGKKAEAEEKAMKGNSVDPKSMKQVQVPDFVAKAKKS
jgi:hypothetical protein